MVRPEYSSPPEIFYNEDTANKYIMNSRIKKIQAEMTERAMELLLLPDHSCLILDIGCGSGLSGITLNEANHFWIGIDISIHMLRAGIKNEANLGGDMILNDIGQNISFKENVFDGVISISAIQWLCNCESKDDVAYHRVKRFYKWLITTLRIGARAVFQFYPDSPEQINLLTNFAIKSGFSGGVVVDYPNSTKKKKYYLCLWAVSSVITKLPEQNIGELVNEEETIKHDKILNKKTKKKIMKRKEWILIKKEKRRKQGLNVKTDSKYTGRRRNKYRF